MLYSQLQVGLGGSHETLNKLSLNV